MTESTAPPMGGEININKILREVPLTDGHNDFAWMIRGWLRNRLDHSNTVDLVDLPIGQTDLQRLEKSRVGCQWWSAFVPCPSKTDDFSTAPLLDTLRTTLQQIDLLHNMFNLYPDTFGFVTESKDIITTFRSGRIASLIGVEGLHQIANSASVLRMFHRLGVRYVTLAHDSNNLYVDSATSRTPFHHGVSSEGHEIIAEMNRIGMIIDLSHTSHEAQRQVLALSTAPVIFSHSSCFALCAHPRNVTDEILYLLKANGGLIMICFLPPLLNSGGEKDATLDQVVDHIVYAGKKIGFSHVGIGSDFDGMLKGPSGLDDIAAYPNLVSRLAQKGLSEDELRQVLGLNLIRVMGGVEETAQRYRARGAMILSDDVSPVWTDEQMSILMEAESMRKSVH